MDNTTSGSAVSVLPSIDTDSVKPLLCRCIASMYPQINKEKLSALAQKHWKSISIHLYGQEINPETYAIATADLLIKGDGNDAKNITYGSTLTEDGHSSMTFDFMLSNPPYGKSWKNDAEKLGSKNGIDDSRFNVTHNGESLSMIPRTSDGLLTVTKNLDNVR